MSENQENYALIALFMVRETVVLQEFKKLKLCWRFKQLSE